MFYSFANYFIHYILFTFLSILLDNSPSPTNYDLKSEFNQTPSTKAFSFGIAREAYSKVYIKENPPSDPSIPGPG